MNENMAMKISHRDIDWHLMYFLKQESWGSRQQWIFCSRVVSLIQIYFIVISIRDCVTSRVTECIEKKKVFPGLDTTREYQLFKEAWGEVFARVFTDPPRYGPTFANFCRDHREVSHTHRARRDSLLEKGGRAAWDNSTRHIEGGNITSLLIYFWSRKNNRLQKSLRSLETHLSPIFNLWGSFISCQRWKSLYWISLLGFSPANSDAVYVSLSSLSLSFFFLSFSLCSWHDNAMLRNWRRKLFSR